jgi:membrane protein
MISLHFIVRLIKDAERDELFSMAGQLTYKMLMAFFPFIVFLMSLLAFLNLDSSYWEEMISGVMPGEAGAMMTSFFDEVINERSKGVLSVSLLLSVYNASSGFFVVMRCVNLTYGYKNCRNFFVNQAISVVLMLMFTLSLISMLVLLIFNDHIFQFFDSIGFVQPYAKPALKITGYLIAAGVLILTLMMVYKLANCRKTKLRYVLPGALFSVTVWFIASKLFNVYVNNFAKYSKTYGSIAGVFILIMWLNIVSTTLLLGSEINSLLDPSANCDEIEDCA